MLIKEIRMEAGKALDLTEGGREGGRAGGRVCDYTIH